MDRFNEVSARFGEDLTDDEMNDLLAEQGELQEKIDAADGWDIDRKVEIAMDALRCPPGDADVNITSRGERRRFALAKLLLSQPDLPLVGQPHNHPGAHSAARPQPPTPHTAPTAVTATPKQQK